MKRVNNVSSQFITNVIKKIFTTTKRKMYIKYSYNETNISTKKINDLIFNEDSLYTCIFKEFLVYEDYNEFLNQYYFRREAVMRLKRITLFYSKYSKMFPNYVSLPESKILYRNLQRKQKMIDSLQKMKKEEEILGKETNGFDYQPITILNTSVQKAIWNNSNANSYIGFNIKDIFNESYDNDYHNGNSNNITNVDDKYIVCINTLISHIEEMQKSNIDRKIKVRIVSLNKKDIVTSKLKKFHSFSPEQKKNISNLICKKKKQNASSSTNATSFQITLNNNHNNSKDKIKGLDSKSNKYMNFLNNCILKNNHRISSSSMTPISKHNQSSSILNNSTNINLGNFSCHSQKTKITYKQNKPVFNNVIKSDAKQNNLSHRINSSKPSNVSKINIQSIKTKLHKNILPVEYWTHRANQKSQIDFLNKDKVFSKLNIMQSRNSLLSHLSKNIQNINYNKKSNGLRLNNDNKLLRKNQSISPNNKRMNKMFYINDSERKKEDAVSFYLDKKQVYVYHGNDCNNKYKQQHHYRLINKNH